LAKRNKQLPVLEKVAISAVAAEGKAVAKVNDWVIFVPFAAPGDVADIRLTRKKNNYAEGRAVRYHQYSPWRTQPFCRHFGVCGGCQWQHLRYDEQIKNKLTKFIVTPTSANR
jgi:23S rRNA (uracil1939-C5)-methyltransferase